MAVRAINNRSIFCSTSSPPISAFQSCSCYSRALQPRKLVKRGFVFHTFRTERNLILHGGIRSCSTHSLFDMVMEELAVMRKTKRIRATSKVVMNIVEEKDEKRVLQKGLLLEFKKDSQRVMLAVVQKPDGKKNWMVYDQVL